jgi:hypothetical protein
VTSALYVLFTYRLQATLVGKVAGEVTPLAHAPEFYLPFPSNVIHWARFHDEDMATSEEQIILQAMINIIFSEVA